MSHSQKKKKEKYKKLIFFLIEKYFRALIPQWYTISWIIPTLRSISHHLVQQNNWREEYEVQTWRIRPGCCSLEYQWLWTCGHGNQEEWNAQGRYSCNGIPKSPKSSKTSNSFLISSCSALSQGQYCFSIPSINPTCKKKNTLPVDRRKKGAGRRWGEEMEGLGHRLLVLVEVHLNHTLSSPISCREKN